MQPQHKRSPSAAAAVPVKSASAFIQRSFRGALTQQAPKRQESRRFSVKHLKIRSTTSSSCGNLEFRDDWTRSQTTTLSPKLCFFLISRQLLFLSDFSPTLFVIVVRLRPSVCSLFVRVCVRARVLACVRLPNQAGGCAAPRGRLGPRVRRAHGIPRAMAGAPKGMSVCA